MRDNTKLTQAYVYAFLYWSTDPSVGQMVSVVGDTSHVYV
jgi:hypothetical protein